MCFINCFVREEHDPSLWVYTVHCTQLYSVQCTLYSGATANCTRLHIPISRIHHVNLCRLDLFRVILQTFSFMLSKVRPTAFRLLWIFTKKKLLVKQIF